MSSVGLAYFPLNLLLPATKTKWVTTREPNLLKNAASGRFYGRFNVAGKQKWVNLKTDVFTVAKLRLADERVAIGRGRLAEENVASGTATMREIATIYLSDLNASPGMFMS